MSGWWGNYSSGTATSTNGDSAIRYYLWVDGDLLSVRPKPTTTPSRLTVYRVGDKEEEDSEVWHWAVFHYRDQVGQRTHVTTRWGRCTRWEDALGGGLAALANEYREVS